MSKPAKLGNVWVAGAAIRFIDETAGKWVTVARCMDTPNVIQTELAKARKANPGKTLWVKSDVNGNYIPN